MSNGYNSNGSVDITWWLDQIQEGEKFRKKMAHEDMWETWRKYYRGEWNNDVQPSNIYFKMLRTTVPRIYFRDPVVSITPAKPGIENMLFAKILERIDNKLLRKMKIKRQMKRIVHDTFMFGTGFGKLGYGAEFSPSDFNDAGEAPTGSVKRPNKVEYNSNIQPNQPWYLRTGPGSIILPSGLEEFDEARWVVHKIMRPRSDVLDDARLKIKDKKSSRNRSFLMTSIDTVMGVQQSIDMVTLFEVRDKKTGSVFIISPDFSEEVLLKAEDEFQVHGSVPIYSVNFNPDDMSTWGVPDSQILDPIQRELNETNTQIMWHRRMSLRKIFTRKNLMSESEKSRMVSEEIQAVIEVDGDPRTDILFKDGNNIPDDLFKAQDATRTDGRESLGFSRNQFGEYNPGSSDTTAREATIVNNSSEIRIDERRDTMADMLTDVVNDVHHIIFNKWGTDEVIDIIGPAGVTMWVSFKGEMLKRGQYNVNVDPDTAINQSRQQRQNTAIQVYNLLKQDPMVDQFQLRSYLMTEMAGTQFDNMLKLPQEQLNGTQNNPLSLEEAGQQFRGPQVQATGGNQ
ncbi:MAG: hypothetical protein COA94_04755 [Rickettsiales bacterium]|nr:MAG: hypothetical protein COA94_04755 [Rickettsiales bacterium]